MVDSVGIKVGGPIAVVFVECLGIDPSFVVAQVVFLLVFTTALGLIGVNSDSSALFSLIIRQT